MSAHPTPNAKELLRHGIETVPASVYLWGGYRYSNASDALAAAKRKPKT
jgi:hypothetical protein